MKKFPKKAEKKSFLLFYLNTVVLLHLMEMLNKYIQIAKAKWLKKLYSYCQALFENYHIPSHDHTHHLRVWEYSKEILVALENHYELDYELIEASIISSFFHDTGLTKTLNENHGQESRNICQQYFNDNKLQKPENWDDILLAIEKHDDKDYKITSSNPASILSILCNADDLDAFGKIGVVRYTEIYLLRGISLNELPELVIKNLDKRFSNFEKTYKAFPELFNKHKERYLDTRNYYEALKKEI